MLSNSDITLPNTQAEVEELEAESVLPEARPETRAGSVGGRIARAALVLMAGTILSRVLGLGREVTIAGLFGVGSSVDAFTVANHVATIVYDLLISGTVSAALVPVLSEYAADKERRPEFGRLLSTILTLAAIFLAGAIVLLEIFAAPLVGFMGAGFSPETQDLALTMTRWVLIGVFFMGLSGVVMGALYSLERFVLPAFTSALYNVAIIFSALTLSGLMGVKSLAFGLVLGAFAMLAFQAPGLRDVPLRPALNIRHPAVLKIFKLYAPVAVSVLVSSGALIIDRNLASQTGEGSISAMRYATTLVQFALGMVSAAISLAALPTLSQHFSRGDSDGYKRTLAAGLRLVSVLVLPAATVLFALAVPIVGLVFRHGAFNVSDQDITVRALLFYVPGLPFAAIDQVLIFAFYARKNTLTPVLVGIAAVGVYLVIALSTLHTMGMTGLILANTAQLTFHALVTGFLLVRAMRKEGGLRGYGIGDAIWKAGASAVGLGLLSFVVWKALEMAVHPTSIVNEAILLGIPALAGGALYVACIWMMRMPELELIGGKVMGRLRR